MRCSVHGFLLFIVVLAFQPDAAMHTIPSPTPVQTDDPDTMTANRQQPDSVGSPVNDSADIQETAETATPDTGSMTPAGTAPSAPYLFVKSTPAAASLSVDNTFVGKTPFVCTPSAGPHSFTLSHSGYQTYTTDISVTPRLNDTLDIHLQTVPATAFMGKLWNRKNRQPRLITFGSVAAVSAVGTAVMMLRMHESYTAMEHANMYPDHASEYESNQDNYYRSRTAKRFFLGLGLLSGTGFVVSLLF